MGAFFALFGFTMYFHFYKNGFTLFLLGFIILLSTMAI
jgi:hypothetical protein